MLGGSGEVLGPRPPVATLIGLLLPSCAARGTADRFFQVGSGARFPCDPPGLLPWAWTSRDRDLPICPPAPPQLMWLLGSSFCGSNLCPVSSTRWPPGLGFTACRTVTAGSERHPQMPRIVSARWAQYVLAE